MGLQYIIYALTISTVFTGVFGSEDKPKPMEMCSEICPFIFQPTCGYDGKIYTQFSNECLLKVAQCQARNQGKPEPQIVSLGLCTPTPKKHNENIMNCPDACPAVYNPVCGYDGVTYMTYSNSCVLGIAQCNSRQKGSPAPVQVDNSFCNI